MTWYKFEGSPEMPANRDTKLNHLLTVKQVAEQLQVSERAVRRWIAVGTLRVRRYGRCVRIDPDDLDAFGQEGTDDDR